MTPLASPLLLATIMVGHLGAAPAAPLAPVRDLDLSPVRAIRGTTFASRPAAFTLSANGVPVPYEVLATTVLPGEALTLDLGEAPAGEAARFELRYARGGAQTTAAGRWRWTAPDEPGIVALSIRSPTGGIVRLNVLVAHPTSTIRDGTLNGFRIGSYQQTPLRGDPAYLPPTGFVEVAAGDEDVMVSPHFTLGQFLCKQEGLRRFMVLSTPLVMKLEAVLEAANASGIEAPGLVVMSGFRTPWYNRAIGNTTDYSRHLWGDAADIYIDRDGDGDMDDLDGNGRVDLDDARVLAAVVDQVEAAGVSHLPVGGVGLYRRNAAHGPFVHVDARGSRARW